MSVNLGQAVAYIDLDAKKFESGLKRVSAQFKTFADTTNSTGERLTGLGNGLKDIGANMTKYITVPLVAMGAMSTKAAVDFQSAFTGVKKTVEASAEQLAVLEKGIRDMAKEMPTAANEIAGVAEAAGQLGIQTDNILGFTKTMVMLGDTTNMSAEEAATQLARLANITGMSQQDFDRLGSTIVDLGECYCPTTWKQVA